MPAPWGHCHGGCRVNWPPTILLRRPYLGLALAAAASLAELAPIVALLRQGAPLHLILAAGLAYQAGGAVTRWLPAERSAWMAIALLAGAIFVISSPGEVPWYLALAAGAWSLQAARRRHACVRPADHPTTAQKRAARVAGFVVAALIPLGVSLAAVFITIVTVCILRLKAIPKPRPHLSGHPIEAVMILHQAHYFVYCYALLFILNQVAGGPAWVGVWFGVGWVTYLSAECLWSRAPLPHAFIIGHLFAAAALAGLAVFGSAAWGAIVFWSLTGLGGGTVYCLTRLHRESGGSSETLDLAEDVGHIGGAAIALVLVLLVGLDARGLVVVGGVFALATIVGFVVLRPMLTIVRRG